MKPRLHWWKVLAILLLYYTVVAGFLTPVPRLPILNESIRLFYFHFSLWCTMLMLFVFSRWSSIGFLRTNKIAADDRAALAATVGVLFGILGLATGMLWGKATWGTFWTSDPKLNNTAISLLI